LEDNNFLEFTKYIKSLKEIWIPLILIYWWWNQITKEYEKQTWKLRKKWSDWKNYTNKDILEKWVIPAYKDLSLKLSFLFWKENLNIFTPNDTQCIKQQWLWEVWIPKNFNKSFDKNKINLIPFVWVDIWSNDILNINADDIVKIFAEKYTNIISNIVFLTWTWWLNNTKMETITFMTKKKLDLILIWEDKDIKVDWWMLKKIQTINSLLEVWISKITITSLSGLREELEWFWSWTMFIDLNKAKYKKLENRAMFELIYDKNIFEWKWKKRDEEDKTEIFNSYKVLEIEWTILWGYSLIDTEIQWEKWKLLQCLYASKEWNWIWKLLWFEMKKETVIFAYSKSWWFFEKLWFKKIEWKKSETWADLYIYKKNT